MSVGSTMTKEGLRSFGTLDVRYRVMCCMTMDVNGTGERGYPRNEYLADIGLVYNLDPS